MCEVAVQEPFCYTKVYALETCRLLNASTIGLHPNFAHISSAQAHYTDHFLNECDHIKVTFLFLCFHAIASVMMTVIIQ